MDHDDRIFDDNNKWERENRVNPRDKIFGPSGVRKYSKKDDQYTPK